MIFMDFETRSACNLLKAGARVYAEHPTTQVLCLGYAFDDGPVFMWHRSTPGISQAPFPEELVRRIEAGELIEAHNAQFERNVYRYCLSREFPWFPDVDEEQWRCSAAKAAALALPRSLELLAKALRLAEQKDMEGNRVMLKCSRPRKPRKAEVAEMRANGINPSSVLLWNEDEKDIRRTHAYCSDDVKTERAASKSCRDLSPKELRIWQMDQRMNARGITCDVAMAQAAIDLAGDAVTAMNAHLHDVTEGAVATGSSREALKKWLRAQGHPLPDTQGATVEAALGRPGLPDHVKIALNVCLQVNRTSTAKYQQMLIQLAEDGRIHDTQLYHGATTGRWTGKGIQVHNFVRGFKNQMDEVCRDILTRRADVIEVLWGSIMDVLAKATRGALIPAAGKELVVGDFAAIEARVLFWLAGAKDALSKLEEGEDIYCDLAEAIHNRPINKKDHPDERQEGKTGILGLGYGMGAPKFHGELAKNGVPRPLAFAKRMVNIYRREKYPEVPTFWYALEAAAIQAVREGEGSFIQVGEKIGFGMRGRFLHARLPSSRLLSYCEPVVIPRVNWTFQAMMGDEPLPIMATMPPKATQEAALFRARRLCAASGYRLLPDEPQVRSSESLTFMGMDDKNAWSRQDTYGGKLAENVTQAAARDLMAEAMLRADEEGIYELLMAVHDELVCEADIGAGSVKGFEQLMSARPNWASDCPVATEGWIGARYKKV